MDAALFLAQFGHLADSPGGVGKLRNLILEMAVRGQLVPQNPDDEPASHLLKRIEVEKARLVKAGEIRPSKPLPPVGEDEIPYDVPDGWACARLGDLGETNVGLTYSPKDISNYGIPVLRANNVQNGNLVLTDLVRVNTSVKNSVLVNEGDLLICARSGSSKLVGKVALVSHLPEQMAFGAFMAIFRSAINHYLYYFIASPLFRQSLDAVNTTTINQITQANLRTTIAPIPPLAEQERIVARVDELMALCDQLEAEQAERDHLRERSAKSTLYHLTDAPTRAEARRYWHYAEQNFPHLFDRSATVADLRATILQLAVQGRLVRQNSDDEPASDLLKRIEAEKARLIETGEIKRSKPLPPIREDEAPYALPDGWEWVRFGQITFNRDAERVPLSKDERQTRQGEYPYYGASGIIDSIDDYIFDEPLLLIGEDGANLLARSTPIAFIAHGRYWVNNHAHVIDGYNYDFLRYMEVFINAISLEPYVTGTAQPKMNQAKMNSIPIALPSLAEQQRIVAKVDELMALCGQLEAAADERRALSGRLFDSIVYHLFELSVFS